MVFICEYIKKPNSKDTTLKDNIKSTQLVQVPFVYQSSKA
jgi:hypothetical protein